MSGGQQLPGGFHPPVVALALGCASAGSRVADEGARETSFVCLLELDREEFFLCQ
jgi:hypothetical protein